MIEIWRCINHLKSGIWSRRWILRKTFVAAGMKSLFCFLFACLFVFSLFRTSFSIQDLLCCLKEIKKISSTSWNMRSQYSSFPLSNPWPSRFKNLAFLMCLKNRFFYSNIYSLKGGPLLWNGCLSPPDSHWEMITSSFLVSSLWSI